jgi:hypothetical protein
MDKKTIRLAVIFSAVIIIGITLCLLYDSPGAVTTPESFFCGDGMCRYDENESSCPEDCGQDQDNNQTPNNTNLEEEYFKAVEDCQNAGIPPEQCIRSSPTYEQYKSWCEEQGGYFGYVGLYPVEQCNLPTPDGGSNCTDSSECEGMCVARLTPEQDDKITSGEALQNMTGTCTSYKKTVGCLAEVINGTVEYIICID